MQLQVHGGSNNKRSCLGVPRIITYSSDSILGGVTGTWFLEIPTQGLGGLGVKIGALHQRPFWDCLRAWSGYAGGFPRLLRQKQNSNHYIAFWLPVSYMNLIARCPAEKSVSLSWDETLNSKPGPPTPNPLTPKP